jgi:hypothetical protein
VLRMLYILYNFMHKISISSHQAFAPGNRRSPVQGVAELSAQRTMAEPGGLRYPQVLGSRGILDAMTLQWKNLHLSPDSMKPILDANSRTADGPGSEEQGLKLRASAEAEGVYGQLQAAQVLTAGAGLFREAQNVCLGRRSRTDIDIEKGPKTRDRKWRILHVCTSGQQLNEHCQSAPESGHLPLTPAEIDDVLQQGIRSISGELAERLINDHAALREMHRELVYLDRSSHYHHSWRQKLADDYLAEHQPPLSA